MSLQLQPEAEVQIGHVLFIDAVGYSKLLTSEQREVQHLLNRAIRETKAFISAETEGKLTKLPTGDGMALVFFTTPEAPVRCALEISRALPGEPPLKLRMGIHSGPVSPTTDLNERSNVAGAGINLAQRVMMCGDAGHILLSSRVADDLAQYGHWLSYLHELGEIETKHGERISIVNLYGDGAGNSELPQKFTQVGERDVAAPRQKLAVLPFVSDDNSSDYDYFSEGIAEGIINILSQSPRLQVIARNTTFRYRSSALDLQKLGRTLGVDAIFTGRISRRNNQLSIKAELVDAHDGTQLWGQKYKCDPDAGINIEESITNEIAEKLRVRFSAQQQVHAAKARTENTDAYHDYLRGRYYWNTRNEGGLRRAVAFFKDALDKDPTFARAWAGLADCYTVLGCWGIDPPHDSYPKAKAAAKEAIALDEYLAEAHSSLAVTHKDYEWDWASAEREYQRALELNPNYALGHHWYGEYLACVGKHNEAIQQLERARELDPLSLVIAATLGRHGYFFARQYDRALEVLRKITKNDPEFWIGHNFLAWVYTMNGQSPEAIEQFMIAQQLDQNPETLVGLGYVFGLSGNVDEARKILSELKKLREQQYVQPVDIALVHTGLGEKDEAFLWLDKACEERAQWFSEIKADPAFDPLRSDARFLKLLERIGLA